MIPALAVTASAMIQDRKTIMATGFEGHQSKPLNVKAFLEAVRQVLDRTPEQRGH
jgi:CheY-like chemotaxis protein